MAAEDPRLLRIQWNDLTCCISVTTSADTLRERLYIHNKPTVRAETKACGRDVRVGMDDEPVDRNAALVPVRRSEIPGRL